jgi:hypothetical protein
MAEFNMGNGKIVNVGNKYIVRYWPDNIGQPSKEKTFGSEKAALDFAKERAMDHGNYYAVYECKIIKTNID